MVQEGDATDSDPRHQVVVACRVLEEAGQGDMVWGHVSVRDPDGRGLWLKGSHLGFDEVTERDVILLGFDGEVLEGTAGRHVEYPIHTEIMVRRPDVGAVVHTHPLYSVAFAATGWPLLALSHEGSHFVPPDIARFTVTSDVIRTKELGERLADTLGDRNAVLLPHHGIVTAGSDVGQAVAGATHLERACQIGLLAGKDAIATPDAEALVKQGRTTHRFGLAWEYLSRTVMRRCVS
jgi:L-ribulose-5-phosphate 4-epimerase